MQLNGIGSGHSGDAHQVTQCLHDHGQQNRKGGAGPVNSLSAQTVQTGSTGQPEVFSLSTWLDRVFGSGKRLLRSIWGSNETAAQGEAGDKTGEAQVLAQIRENSDRDGISANVEGQQSRQPDPSRQLHDPQIAAAATAVNPSQDLKNNPYFSAVEDIGRQQETLWQKVKVKFKNITGQLSGRLQGKAFGFQTKSSFDAKKERPREDLRKHSKFHKDELEIDCVLTDDSYLMDSYDRKGEYSTLSIKK